MLKKPRPPHKKRHAQRSLKRKLKRHVLAVKTQTHPLLPSVALAAWQLTGAAITGLAHWQKHQPCQDAVCWSQQPRPVLVLSDGAGSAAVSEIGAQTLTQGMLRFVDSLEDEVAQWLDGEHTDAQLQALNQIWRLRLLRHAQGLLQDLACQLRRNIKDVRATLQMVVVGQKHCFWWQVGDGSIVAYTLAKETLILHSMGSHAQTKGEFANQTCFVDIAKPEDAQCGQLPTYSVFGWVLMSDGGAEKLVSLNGQKVASRLAQWLNQTSANNLSPDKLALAYHDRPMWERTTLDDRAIVLAARHSPNANVMLRVGSTG